MCCRMMDVKISTRFTQFLLWKDIYGIQKKKNFVQLLILQCRYTIKIPGLGGGGGGLEITRSISV